MRYVDQENNITQKYPFNPNGSPNGRAAISSECGRHLAIMPHPERTIYGWQLPIKFENKYSPWFIIFKNVYNWCSKDYDDLPDVVFLFFLVRTFFLFFFVSFTFIFFKKL